MWDDAYEAALRGINDATEGNVSDDWSDNIAGIVEVVLEVLAWAGVVLAIAALIIGGPFIALIAAVVGVIALLGTLFLWHKGRRGLGDVAWAVVGVLPFGKLGKLFQSGKRLTGLKEFLGGPYLEIATPLRRMTALRGLTNPANLRAGGELGQRAAQRLASRLGRDFSAFQGAGPRNILNRIIGGSSRGYALALADNFADLSAHHQRVVTPHLGKLAEVISGGAKSVPLSEAIFNVSEFVVKRGRMVDARAGDVQAMGSPSPVDAWRVQLRGLTDAGNASDERIGLTTMATTDTHSVPPFRLMLPVGWEELPADESAVQALAERSSEVFRSAHRPDLDVQFRRLLQTAARKMAQGRVFALLPADRSARGTHPPDLDHGRRGRRAARRHTRPPGHRPVPRARRRVPPRRPRDRAVASRHHLRWRARGHRGAGDQLPHRPTWHRSPHRPAVHDDDPVPHRRGRRIPRPVHRRVVPAQRHDRQHLRVGVERRVKYEIQYDAGIWFPAPEQFPTVEWPDEAAWADALVAEFEADLGTLDDDARAAVREFAVLARAQRTPLATECLLFCPRSVPALGVANIFIGEHDGEPLDLEHESADDERALLPATVIEFPSEHLGLGRRAAIVLPSSEPGIAAGRLNYVFDAGGVAVAVNGTTDSARDAGLMAPFLDELVRGIRVEAA